MKKQNTTLFVVGASLGLCIFGLHLASCLQASPMTERPQVNNADLFSLLLGDARQLMSDAMIAKAEVYFHGGLDIECDHREHSAEGDSHHDETHDREEDEHAPEPISLKNPWGAINQAIHEQKHIHLSDAGCAELLPLYWAACRVAPKNIEAYENAAYVLNSNLKRPDEALKLLDEGIRHNPTTYRLDFYKGQLALSTLRDPVRAARWFSEAWRKMAAGKEASAMQDRPRLCFYLGYLAIKRGDRQDARNWLTCAQAADAQSASTHDLAKLLEYQP